MLSADPTGPPGGGGKGGGPVVNIGDDLAATIAPEDDKSGPLIRKPCGDVLSFCDWWCCGIAGHGNAAGSSRLLNDGDRDAGP